MAAALLALVVASSIGAAMAELARVEVVLARQRTATAAALAAVDACTEGVVAALPAGWTFDDVLRGADGLPGTADDGVVPLAAGCSGTTRAAPGAPVPPRLLLQVEATHRGGRRRLEAVIGRHRDAGVPALVWVADDTAIGRVTGLLTLDGNDLARPAAPISILAAPDAPDALDTWVTTQGASVVASAESTPPIWASPPPLVELIARATAAGAIIPASGLVSTPPAPANLMLSLGDLLVSTPLTGAGVLLVDGVLQVETAFTFTGVVAATGGIRVGPSGHLDVQGALWLGGASLEALTIDGIAQVTASAAALAAADALLPLPRRARLASVLDF
jgi:hypothetical protein